MDVTLSLALSIHKDSPLAFSAAALNVLFPRFLMRLLPDGCQGRVVVTELEKRCMMLSSGDVAGLVRDSNDAPIARVDRATTVISASPTTFSKIARATSLVGAREVGRA
jgi:hypothetical protein